jgi:hypothetical protein
MAEPVVPLSDAPHKARANNHLDRHVLARFSPFILVHEV